jgi:hypothetical protein
MGRWVWWLRSIRYRLTPDFKPTSVQHFRWTVKAEEALRLTDWSRCVAVTQRLADTCSTGDELSYRLRPLYRAAVRQRKRWYSPTGMVAGVVGAGVTTVCMIDGDISGSGPMIFMGILYGTVWSAQQRHSPLQRHTAKLYQTTLDELVRDADT